MIHDMKEFDQKIFVEVIVSDGMFSSERNWVLVEDPNCEGGWTYKGLFMTRGLGVGPKTGKAMMQVQNVYKDENASKIIIRQWMAQDLGAFHCKSTVTFYKFNLNSKDHWEKGTIR